MKPHGFHREAQELGGRFFNEMEKLISEVCHWPHLYRYIQPPIRRHFSSVFPYGILYEEKPDEIRIIAVMCLHRDPNYWLHRTR